MWEKKTKVQNVIKDHHSEQLLFIDAFQNICSFQDMMDIYDFGP